jgi:Flp pilus assembly protein TadD
VGSAELERAAYEALAVDPAQAEVQFAALVATHPQSSSALLGLGLARLAQQDVVAAVGSLERARGLSRSPRITATLAVAYDALGRHDQAQDLYRAALELRPEDVETLNNLGVSYTRAERFREAVYVFRGALTLRPENPGLERTTWASPSAAWNAMTTRSDTSTPPARRRRRTTTWATWRS